MALKLIYHTSDCKNPDDPSLPYRLDLVMRAPEFLIVAWAMLHGGVEEIIARASTLEELNAWMQEHRLAEHPRLTRYTIKGPGDEVLEQYPPPSSKERDAHQGTAGSHS